MTSDLRLVVVIPIEVHGYSHRRTIYTNVYTKFAREVKEDPVTGSASGPQAVYLGTHGVMVLPEGGGTVRAIAEQGDAMGQPGRVTLDLTGRPGKFRGPGLLGRR